MSLLDKWSRLAEERDGLLQYGSEEGEVAPLLHTPLDPGLDDLSLNHRLLPRQLESAGCGAHRGARAPTRRQ